MRRRAWSQALLLLTLSAALALVSAAVHPRRPPWQRDVLGPGEVSLDAAERWGDSALWVDARPADIFTQGHVPGALHLDLAGWDAGFPAFLDGWKPGQKVLVYCGASSCHLAEEVAARLRNIGIDPVYVLKGGWEGWLSRHPTR